MTKSEARTRAKALRTALDRRMAGAAMDRQLSALPCWHRAEAVLAFAALPDEPDTGPLLARALAEGKRLFLPRVTGKTTMEWVEIPALALLTPGAFGIPEPPAHLPAAELPQNATLALIPCLAASPDGVRLGRGGGYYDRFLAHYKGGRMLLCPASLLLPELPADSWDIRFSPDEILTEKGTLV